MGTGGTRNGRVRGVHLAALAFLPLARALLSDARFLILDEPTTELAARVVAKIPRASGERGVLLITHDPALADACDRVVRMGEARVETDAD